MNRLDISDRDPVLTAKVGNNADLFPDILDLYLPPPAEILDMTYGRGVFWKDVDVDGYGLYLNDIDSDRGVTSYDFTEHIPYPNECMDGVVLDPPYLYVGGFKTLKESIDKGYKNKERSLNGVRGVPRVHQMYALAMIQAYRLLKKKGIFIVKCMDQVMSGKQTWMHIEIQKLAEILGFKSLDQFVMVSNSTPTMRHKVQLHARRNHSFFLVLQK